MEKEEIKERIEKLKEAISRYRYAYHVENREDISPDALDSLKHELWVLEQENPEFITPDSPTQRVGGEPLKEFKKVKHQVPMRSIEDIFSEKELYDWQDYLKRMEPDADFEYFSELKIDGFAVSLVYEKGLFVEGSTRGNGILGEDVTQNLKTIESIPLRLELKNGFLGNKKAGEIKNLIENGRIEIRGEVYMEKKDFEKFNRKLEKDGEKSFSNPRNLAAGSIRQLDSKLAASRPLKFLAYDILNFVLEKHSQEHEILPLFGFKTDQGKICRSLEEIVKFKESINGKRDQLPHQIDGIVINVNDNRIFQKLGVVGKSPRGVRAFKFSPKQATTKVLNIQVHVGRTGTITPVAELSPVEVGGVTISRATLHNEDEIKRLGVKIGDTVVIERAGDVIPAVNKVLTELRNGSEKDFHFPKACPICKTKLLKPKGEVIWRCPNLECPSRKRENLYHFASAFDIKGLGPKIIDRLVDENLVFQASDLFYLKKEDINSLERFGEKSAEKLVRTIKMHKEVNLASFIYALGIRHVGIETSESLANHFLSLEKFKKTNREELEKIHDIGPNISESIACWLIKTQNQDFISRLLEAGIKILSSVKVSKKLEGKNFVLTGTLKSISRTDAEKRIRILGGGASGSISRNTDYLVLGENPGSKFEKAKSLGVKIIGEKEFLEMIK